MKEFLSQRGIKYTELNVAEDDKAKDEMMKKTGRMAVPTITVGNHAVIGFDKSELEKLLS